MKNETFIELRFQMYNRKSSEQEERQALSIPSQIEQNTKIQKEYNVKLGPEDVLSEAKSAKKSGTRPLFNKLLNDIERGKVQGIIAWHPDRLSRNAGDAGRLVDLFDSGKLYCIITRQQIFKNTPSDKFFLTMLCSQAKLENDNKGVNVMRGLIKKREMGYPPGMAKIGYVNDKGEKGYRRTLPDPEKCELVKKLFQMYLSGKHGVRELHRIAVEEMGLTTIQRKRMGGKPIKLSMLYKMLQDPFYAGFFFGKNDEGEEVRYEVNKSVPRMITEAQHRQILAFMHRKNMPRPWSHKGEFPYKRFMICGSCGGSVTAERKPQMICGNCKFKFAYMNKTECPKCGIGLNKMSDKKILNYVFYHCCKKKHPECPEGSIKESDIDGTMQTEVVSKLAISEALKEWCLNSIQGLEQREQKDIKTVDKSWYTQLQELDNRYERLKEAYLGGVFSEEEFQRDKDKIAQQKLKIKQKMGLGGDQRVDMGDLEKKLDILTEIADIVENGEFDEKVGALSILGSNLKLKARKVSVSKDIFYETLQKGLLEARAKNPRFEPEITLANKDETEVFTSVRPTLLRMMNEVRTCVLSKNAGSGAWVRNEGGAPQAAAGPTENLT